MKKLLNILSVLVLMAGVVSSVRLVGMNQDNRSRASKDGGVTLCHKTGSDSNPGQTITVNENAIDAHLEHGDSLGECPSNDPEPESNNDQNNSDDQNQQQDENNQESNEQNNNQQSEVNNENNNQTETPNDQNSNEQNNEAVNNVTNNNVVNNNTTNNTTNVVNNPTTNNTSDTTTNTNTSVSQTVSTPTPIPNSFIFDIRPVTTSVGKNDLSVDIDFYQSGREVYSKSTVVKHRENGVFRANLSGIAPGTYDVYLKTEAHLGKVFRNVNVVSGITTWNFSGTTLIVGDFDNDNKITILDIGQLMSEYTSENSSVNDSNKKYDVNHDGVINLSDLNVVLRYYNTLSIEGDKI